VTAPAWWVYVVRCADGSLYTGVARDLAARIAAHNAGRGARYTRGRGPVTLVYQEAADDRASAQRREAAIKRLPAAAKAGLAAPASADGGPAPRQACTDDGARGAVRQARAKATAAS
jgi:putative endonuclease